MKLLEALHELCLGNLSLPQREGYLLLIQRIYPFIPRDKPLHIHHVILRKGVLGPLTEIERLSSTNGLVLVSAIVLEDVVEVLYISITPWWR